ncbi:MAG: hypothetical protein M9947_11915 [Thermomicrobiales bacterium]|nr:hypothetical protein [Thermomicrobiales bacterium]
MTSIHSIVAPVASSHARASGRKTLLCALARSQPLEPNGLSGEFAGIFRL